MSTINRINKISDIIIRSDSSVTVRQLAKTIGVSEKTIRNDLLNLEPLLKENNLNLKKIPGIGIKIEGEDREKKKFMQSTSNNSYTGWSVKQRQENILLRLLSSPNPILIKELSVDYFVSRATITEDIKNINTYLLPYDQVIKNVKTIGLVLEGREEGKRKILSDLMPVNLSAGKDQRTIIGENSVKDSVLSIVTERLNVDVSKLIPIIEHAQEKLKYTFSTEGFINLIIHLAIAINRSQGGNEMEIVKGLKDNFSSDDYRLHIARETAETIETEFQIKFQESEVYYILIHFLGAKTLKSEIDLDSKVTLENDELEKKLIYFVKKIQNELNLYLEKDIHLINNLILHLKPAVNRLQYNLTLENPLKKEIMYKYSNIYSAVSNQIKFLNNLFRIQFPEDEIAYITLHFAAAVERSDKPIRTLIVCSSGIGMSQLMVAQISKLFRNIDIVGSISLLDIPKYTDNNIDLIISTIDIGEVANIQTVLVNPLLSMNDINNIGSLIAIEKPSLNSSPLFADFTFHEIEESISKEDVLKYINTELIKRNKVTENYYSSLLDRETIGSTYIGHGVAAAHGAMNEVESSCIQVIKLRNKILWDKENEVNFIINFVVRKQDSEVFSTFFKNLGCKLDDDLFWYNLTNESNSENVLILLKEELMYVNNE